MLLFLKINPFVYSDIAKVKGDSGKKLEFFIETISGNEVPCTWERQFPLMGTK